MLLLFLLFFEMMVKCAYFSDTWGMAFMNIYYSRNDKVCANNSQLETPTSEFSKSNNCITAKIDYRYDSL